MILTLCKLPRTLSIPLRIILSTLYRMIELWKQTPFNSIKDYPTTVIKSSRYEYNAFNSIKDYLIQLLAPYNF